MSSNTTKKEAPKRKVPPPMVPPPGAMMPPVPMGMPFIPAPFPPNSIPMAKHPPMGISTTTPARKKPKLTTATSASTPMPTPGSKASKGLRHFSMKVCKKVEEKGKTTYNEVADELVAEFIAQSRLESGGANTPDEKNIRRRVYDALNVLMAMDIIGRNKKKEINWNGLPSNAHHDLEMLQREKQHRAAEVQRKREFLNELLVQQVCFRNLVSHNKNYEKSVTTIQADAPAAEAAAAVSESMAREASTSLGQEQKIPLPFIVVNTSNHAQVNCDMSTDRTEVFFNFSKPFEINDDLEILKRLGFNKIAYSELNKFLPEDLMIYCKEHQMLNSLLKEDSNSVKK